MHRKVILVGDVTTHGGRVLTGSPAHTMAALPIARVGDTVSCPMHDNNAIVGGGNNTFSIDGRQAAVEGMTTACGSKLIASQTMFNTQASDRNSKGDYKQPLWNVQSPIQPQYQPNGEPPFPNPAIGPSGVSQYPPDNIPVLPPNPETTR